MVTGIVTAESSVAELLEKSGHRATGDDVEQYLPAPITRFVLTALAAKADRYTVARVFLY